MLNWPVPYWINRSTVNVEIRSEFGFAGCVGDYASVLASVMWFDGIYVKNAGLASKAGSRDTFRMVRYVMAVMKPFDFQRTIALRNVTRQDGAVASVQGAVELKGTYYRCHCKQR